MLKTLVLLTGVFCFAYLGNILANQPSVEQAETSRSGAYERVTKERVLRCGYFVWPPYLDKDIKTGKFSGWFYELANATGDYLGLKIEWAAEVMSGQQVEMLKTRKIDAICFDGPYTATIASYIRYSDPMMYVPVYLYGRFDDHRFNNNADLINTKDIKLLTLDGDISQDLARKHFPEASTYQLANSVQPSQMMLDVADHKADAVILDPLTVEGFSKTNPDKLRKIPLPITLGIYPIAFSVLPEEEKLAMMLSQGVRGVRNTGIEDKLLDKFAKENPNTFVRPAKGYQH